MSQQIEIKLMGTSMSPQLCENDILYFSPCEKSDLRIGDIVVFKENSEAVIHRLVKYGGDLFFKGDASLVLSPIETVSDIFGVVICYQRGSRTYQLSSYSSLLSFLSVLNSYHYPGFLRRMARFLINCTIRIL